MKLLFLNIPDDDNKNTEMGFIFVLLSCEGETSKQANLKLLFQTVTFFRKIPGLEIPVKNSIIA